MISHFYQREIDAISEKWRRIQSAYRAGASVADGSLRAATEFFFSSAALSAIPDNLH